MKHNAKVPEHEFVRMWLDAYKKGLTVKDIAQALGVDERNVHRRRRRMEKKYGALPTLGNRSRLSVPYDAEHINRKKPYTVVVFGDAHWWPGVDSPATDLMVKCIKDIQPNVIIANGDIFDGSRISRHPNLGWEECPTVKEELDEVKRQMKRIQNAAPDAVLHWNWGNHDERFDTYLSTHVGAFEGIDGYSLKDHLTDWKAAVVTVLNDHTVVKHRFKGGKHAVYNNIEGANIVTNHTHRLLLRTKKDYSNTYISVESGCLLDPLGSQMRYAEGNALDMHEGWSILHIDGERLRADLVHVEKVGGKAEALYNGKKYKV